MQVQAEVHSVVEVPKEPSVEDVSMVHVRPPVEDVSLVHVHVETHEAPEPPKDMGIVGEMSMPPQPPDVVGVVAVEL